MPPAFQFHFGDFCRLALSEMIKFLADLMLVSSLSHSNLKMKNSENQKKVGELKFRGGRRPETAFIDFVFVRVGAALSEARITT